MSGAATLTAVFCLMLGATLPVHAQSTFVPGFEDLPLMPDLDPSADAPVVFDAPTGRIVEAQAAGRSSTQRVLSFYRETLPQMGWRVVAGPEGTFEREGERLKLLVSEPARGEVTVRFSLAPAPK